MSIRHKMTVADKNEYNRLTLCSSQITIEEYLVGCQRLTTIGEHMVKQVNVYFDDKMYTMLEYLQDVYFKKYNKKIVKSKLIKELIINSSGKDIDLEKVIHSAIHDSLKEGGDLE